MKCQEILGSINAEEVEYCNAVAVMSRYKCPGRTDAAGGAYCASHGGLARSRVEAESQWVYRAPEAVGGNDEVYRAGRMVDIAEQDVRVRRVPDEYTPRLYTAIVSYDGQTKLRAAGLHRLCRVTKKTRYHIDVVAKKIQLITGEIPSVEETEPVVRPRKLPWVVEQKQHEAGPSWILVAQYEDRDDAIEAAQLLVDAANLKAAEIITSIRGGDASWGLPMRIAEVEVVEPQKLYKCLAADRMSTHGGQGQWLPPGEWMPYIEDIELCRRGYHLCREQDVQAWPAAEIWEAEGAGPRIDGDKKIVFATARLIRRIGGETCSP